MGSGWRAQFKPSTAFMTEFFHIVHPPRLPPVYNVWFNIRGYFRSNMTEDKEHRITVGTSGFSYDDWIGPVYPPGTQKSDMLAFYARELGFGAVELNYTYYTMPAASGVEGMLAKTPDDFRFVVKAHSSLTHKIREADGSFIRNEEAVENFIAGIAPMLESGRLVCVLAQFPLKFGRSREAEEHLKWLTGAMAPVKLVFEFRSGGWVTQSAFDLLKSLGAGYCVVDEPKLPKLARFTPVATADLAYFRFHGRNRKWFGVSASERYDYLYEDTELRQFLAPIKKVSGLAGETMMFFNNHFQGKAVKNAQRMKELLGQGR